MPEISRFFGIVDMKAVRLYGSYDLRVEKVRIPEVTDDTVLIKVIRASICNGSDTAIYSGRRKRKVAYPWMKLPFILGHECAGKIVETGKNIRKFKAGDRVASLNYGGAFAEYQLVAPGALIPVPEGMPYDKATFIEPLYTTFSYAKFIRPGDRVVICGLGPSGQLFVQGVKASGASEICAIDLVQNRVSQAKKDGADIGLVVSRNINRARKKVLDAFGEPDVFVDVTGFDVFELGIQLLTRGGRFVSYGVPDSGVHFDGTRAFFKAVQFRVADKKDRVDVISRMLRLVKKGAIRLGTFTTHHIEIDEVPGVIKRLLKHPEEAIGVVVNVS